MVSDDVISMPDKWEYPWYAAWDLAFHRFRCRSSIRTSPRSSCCCCCRSAICTRAGRCRRTSGTSATSTRRFTPGPPTSSTRSTGGSTGHADLEFLKGIYNKLLLNFTWWVNRKDLTGRNVFEGGFLGLDSIGVLDRRAPLPTGGYLEQADGTAWMAFFAQTMLQISLELALDDRSYVDMALKFFEHFIWIASAMIHIGGKGEMWDEEDGFFYDVLRTPDGRTRQLKVRSMVGLLPLCAATVISEEVMAALPELQQRAGWFVSNRPHLVSNIHDPRRPGFRNRRLLSLLSEERLRRVLSRMLDEKEFLSPYGIRSLSRHHHEHPYRFDIGDHEFRVGYLPAESDSAMFGGNSNWRGPVWLPINGLLVRALLNYYGYYGPNFTVEFPTGSGRRATLYEVAHRDHRAAGAHLHRRRPRAAPAVRRSRRSSPTTACGAITCCSTNTSTATTAPAIGASHQTGWTGLIASLIHYFATISPTEALNLWSPARSRRRPRRLRRARPQDARRPSARQLKGDDEGL